MTGRCKRPYVLIFQYKFLKNVNEQGNLWNKTGLVDYRLQSISKQSISFYTSYLVEILLNCKWKQETENGLISSGTLLSH